MILNKGPTGAKARKKVVSVITSLLMSLPLAMLGMERAEAVGTPAGTSIGNQATATYEDDTANSYTSTSNLVTTTVQPVRNLIVTPNGTSFADPGQTQTSTPGNIVYFPYTLENRGNTPDTFRVTTLNDGTDNFNPVNGSVKVFWDVNGNGIVDVGDTLVGDDSVGNSDGDIDTGAEQVAVIGPVAADAQVKLIVQYQVPPTAVSTNVGNVNLVVTSVGDNTKVDNINFHRVNVVNDAVLSVIKSVNASTIDPSGELIYTFTINNTGNQAANTIVITDAIPANTKMRVNTATPVTTDVSGLGTFSFSNTTTPTVFTHTPAEGSGANVQIDPAIHSIRYSLATLAAASSRTITFTVKVNAAAQNVVIPNFGVFDYTPAGSGVAVTGTNTNIVNTTVNKKSAVTISFSGAPFAAPPVTTSGTDSADTDKTATNSKQPANTSVYYKNVVTNNGNAPDIFNITLSNSLPAGWVASFYTMTDATTGANNTSQLLDTNSPTDGIPDTGTLAPGASVTIITRLFIPPTAADAVTTAIIRAASTNGGTAIAATPTNNLFDLTRDEVPGVQQPSVDIRNIVAGANTDATVALTQSANGATVTFPLNVLNTGSSTDTFNLTSGLPGTFSAQFFPIVTNTTLGAAANVGDTSVTLVSAAAATNFIAGDTIVVAGQSRTVASVAGAVVTFTAGQTIAVAALNGATVVEPGTLSITSTSPVAAAASANVLAVITIPSGTAPGSNNVTFTSTSTNDPTKSDNITDSIVIPEYRTFTLQQNRSGTGAAGAVLFYDHVLTNTGNLMQSFNLTFPASSTFTYQFLDNVTNLPITSISNLAAGAAITFKVKVTIPLGTATGTVENKVLRATETGNSTFRENTDRTEVVSGFISLVKSVRNITTATAASTANQASPGDVLEYAITFTNSGSGTAKKVKLVDLIPANTTYVANSMRIEYTNPVVAEVNPGDSNAAGNGDFNVSTTGGVTYYLGTGATTAVGGDILPGGAGVVKFQVTVN